MAMNNKEFAQKAVEISKLKTIYVNGAFGAPASDTNKKRYTSGNNAYNNKHSAAINKADPGSYFFDCCGLAKGILWGFGADLTKNYGGAKYKSNGVPDLSDAGFMKVSNISTDWKRIPVGACVYTTGHMGIYIGDGLAVEATPAWKNGVQITAVENISRKPGYNYRTWKCWGTIPYVKYMSEEEEMQFSYEIFKQFMNQYIAELKELPADKYAEPALDWAKDTGIMVGDANGNQMPQSYVKREDLAVVLYAKEQRNA